MKSYQADVCGQAIGVLEAGQGPPLVFVHGLPGQALDFAPALDRLSSDWRCIAIDRAGYGTSLPIQDNRKANVGCNVTLLIELLDTLELPAAHLVGWSYGGDIAISAAAAHPERISSLVLVGAAGPSFRWPTGLADRILFRTPLGSSLVNVVRRLGSGAMKPMLDDAYGAEAPSALLDQFVELLDNPRTVSRWLEEGRVWDPASCPAKAVRCPTIVIHGERDTRVPISVARTNAELIPDARTHCLPEAGHWPFHSHPDEFAGLVHEFLSSLATT